MAGPSLVLPLSSLGAYWRVPPSLLLATAAQSAPSNLVSPVTVVEILPFLSCWVRSPLPPAHPSSEEDRALPFLP